MNVCESILLIKPLLDSRHDNGGNHRENPVIHESNGL